jgi:hypothetical protein
MSLQDRQRNSGFHTLVVGRAPKHKLPSPDQSAAKPKNTAEYEPSHERVILDHGPDELEVSLYAASLPQIGQWMSALLTRNCCVRPSCRHTPSASCRRCCLMTHLLHVLLVRCRAHELGLNSCTRCIRGLIVFHPLTYTTGADQEMCALVAVQHSRVTMKPTVDMT